MGKRHPFHSICPYFAMFPEEFVARQLLMFSVPGEIVYDPFCGRGTAVFESLLHGRPAFGSDVNPVAVCIAGAKADPPSLHAVFHRITELEERYESIQSSPTAPTPFFTACFAPPTLSEILFLRDVLEWRSDVVDRFIAAVALGVLHGESHKTELCLSNRMPRTISTKPEYSVRWWATRGMEPPHRKTFEVLRKATTFRYRMPPASLSGAVRQADAREARNAFPELRRRVRLIVTSPPYLDTTDYSEDQWLRLWFLGGEPFPMLRNNADDRHRRVDRYWQFLTEVWAGVEPLLATNAIIVVRIGGAKLSKEQLFEGMTNSLATGVGKNGTVEPLHDGITSSIRPRETSSFRPTRRKESVEHDFVYAFHAANHSP